MARAKVGDIVEDRKKAARLLAVEIDGRKVTVDQRSLTIRESQLLRAELDKIGVKPGSNDWFAGLVWITLRRDNATLTYAQVCESLTIGEVEDAEFVEAEADAPEA
jgi:hypothetical protein